MPLDILGTVRYTPELILKDLKSTRAMGYKVESQFMNSITEKELWLLAFPELFFFFLSNIKEFFLQVQNFFWGLPGCLLKTVAHSSPDPLSWLDHPNPMFLLLLLAPLNTVYACFLA